jgi:hypothetical protein
MVAMFFIVNSKKEIIEVPVEIEVEVPIVEKVFDTVYELKPVTKTVKEIDTSLVEAYKKANDSLKQEMYEMSVTKNEYKKVFEDSIQTITVDAGVTGTLDYLVAEYKTKPRKVEVDTVIKVKVPGRQWSLSPYAEVGIPTNILNPNIVFKGGLDFTSKKGIIYGGSYDTQGRVWAKIGLKF